MDLSAFGCYISPGGVKLLTFLAWARSGALCHNLAAEIAGIMASIAEEDFGESFGQKRPPLYEMIKTILHEYPSGQIFKVD